jgi:hypothetical protein
LCRYNIGGLVVDDIVTLQIPASRRFTTPGGHGTFLRSNDVEYGAAVSIEADVTKPDISTYSVVGNDNIKWYEC